MKKITLHFGGISGKRVEAMASGTLQQGGFFPPPDDALAGSLGKFWVKTGEREVVRHTLSDASGVKPVEVFDFVGCNYYQTYENPPRTSPAAFAIKSLQEIDKALVNEAYDALQKLNAAPKPPSP